MDLIPSGLGAYAARGPEWAGWLDRLPALAGALLEEWELRPDGEAAYGATALVLPVRTTDGARAVLKVSGPHPEAATAHLALQHWHGRAAVRLLRADPRRSALLLERLRPDDLSDAWDVEACEVVAGLYASLHVAAPPQLDRLSAYAAHMADRLGELPHGSGLPPRLVDQARALARGFAGDPETDGRLLHTDLQYAHVLAREQGEQGEWVAIAPAPLSGDPHYEVAPLLWSRYDELAGRLRDGLRQRFHTVVDVAGLDEERARDWVVVRAVDRARRQLDDPHGAGRRTPDAALLTACVTIAKAVQD